MVTRVIIFTALFLIVWISTINVLRTIYNKASFNNRELILRIKVIDYQIGKDYNTIIAEIGDRTCNIRDINKCFFKEMDGALGSYITISTTILHVGFILIEPVIIIKNIRQGY